MAEAKTPAPIDRPLSRAYLREFSGWSTAYAPGLSDPTTLRTMENGWVTREGAFMVRPALRSVFPADNWITTNFNSRIIGSFETFFLNDGTKALLFATKIAGGEVTFRVARYSESSEQYSVISLADAGFDGTTSFSSDCRYVRYVQIDNKVFALPDSPNTDDSVRVFFVGNEKRVVEPQAIPVPEWEEEDAPVVRLPDASWINERVKNTIPAAETPTSGTSDQPLTGTLISSTAADNTFNFGFFITFENELGETPPSQMTVIKTKRGWAQWQFQTAASAGGPSGTATTDPKMACDQLVAISPTSTWNEAIAAGATRWNLYLATWSDQGAVPTDATMVASREIPRSGATREEHGWLQCTPVSETADVLLPVPTEETPRLNYSEPSHASQGLAAGDRITLVNDRQAAAVIRWSSNQLGEYTNFSPSKGGGYKTLTSGNLLVPACVKLWQNPQSVDTLVVLCRGVDGYSTSYYMAPATVTGGTGSTSIMGFEETTATPGTVAPWGCEIVDQSLYHPLDEQLMKSTAANYRISHNSMSEPISNKWIELLTKQNIVSSALDSRIYYIVNNPDGEPLEDGCMGNEIWVLDTGGDGAETWSRWLIQANSLHKLEVGAKLYMAVVRPDTIFVLDDLAIQDEYSVTGGTQLRPIPWKIETNTQGANRAHDAWCNLQQANITVGNFMGQMRYGIRGWDSNGKPVEVAKIIKDERIADLEERPLPWDLEDFLRIGRNMKEWRFFAESVEIDFETQLSYGAINLVQYRYTPTSVNQGYEFGSVETFEYQRASSPSNPSTMYPNGVPASYVDRAR